MIEHTTKRCVHHTCHNSFCGIDVFHSAWCTPQSSPSTSLLLPLLSFSPPACLSEAVPWRHNITNRHPCTHTHIHMDLCNLICLLHSHTHIHIQRRITTHSCAGSHSLAHTFTNNFTWPYCSPWPVMELTHCLIWSAWNHCLTSLVEMRAWGWEVKGCNIWAEVDRRGEKKQGDVRDGADQKWPHRHLEISQWGSQAQSLTEGRESE